MDTPPASPSSSAKPVSNVVAISVLSTQVMADRYAMNGPCCEYVEFEDAQAFSQMRPGLGQIINIWDLTSDAITGRGGFSNGNYLVRFQREMQGAKGDQRFAERVATTKYDNFARRIADAPWNRIITHRDAITRESKDQRVLDFWSAADRRGTPILNVIEYPARQARAYGTGWIFVDRAARVFANRAEEQNPANAPYAYCVPTRNVVDWEFDDDYRLIAVSILEPKGSDDTASADPLDCDLRVWTQNEWAVFERAPGGRYTAIAGGPNLLGEVPAVQLFDGYPGPGRGFGLSVMPTIARFARDVYNKTSELRQVMRKCAMALGIPVKNLELFLKRRQEIGEDVLMPYDGDAGEPKWITPDLTALDKIGQSIKDDKEAAFELAQMTAISGYLQTSSGFHQEAIFSEANTAIAGFANQLEQADTAVTRLVLRYHGETDEQRIRDLASVSYPMDFGIVDKDAIIARTEKRLGLNLGVDDAAETIFQMYVAENPRADRKDLRNRAQQSAQALYVQKALAAAPPAAPADGTARARLFARGPQPAQSATEQKPPADQQQEPKAAAA